MLIFQEWYTESDSTEMVGFELGGKQLTFWPTKRDEQRFTPWDYHVTCLKEHAVMEAPPSADWHVVSPHLGDDEMAEVHLQHAVHFAGNSYLKIYIGSNGFVTFDDYRFAMQLSLQAHYKRVMASVLFSDLNPEEGGVIRYTVRPNPTARRRLVGSRGEAYRRPTPILDTIGGLSIRYSSLLRGLTRKKPHALRRVTPAGVRRRRRISCWCRGRTCLST